MIENTQKDQLKEYWLKKELKDQRPIDRKEAIGQLQLEGWLQYAAIAKQLFASLSQFQEGTDFTDYQNLKQKMKSGELTTINNDPLLRIVAELEKEEEKVTKLLTIAQEKVGKGIEEDGKKSQKDVAHQLYFMETNNFWSVTYEMELIKNPLVVIITLLQSSGIDTAFDKIYGQKTGAIGFFGRKDFGIEGSQVSLIVNKLGNIKTLKHELNHALFELLANALKPKAEILGIKRSAWPEPLEFPQRVKENFLEDVRQYCDELKEPNSPLMTWCLDMAKNELLAKFTGNGVFSDSYMRRETPVLGTAESYDYATQWIYYQASLSINGNFGNRSIMMHRLIPEYMAIIKPIIEKADELIKISKNIPGYIEMLPWLLIQIPMSQWLEKINDILIPDIQYRKKYLEAHPAATNSMDPTISGFRYYRAGLTD